MKKIKTLILLALLCFVSGLSAQTVANTTASEEEMVTIEVKGSGGYAYVGEGTDRKVKVAKGTTVFVRAAALEDSGKKFAYWTTKNTMASGKGIIETNQNPYEFVATENIALYVNFVPEDTDLNVLVETDATPGGIASVNGFASQNIPLGAELILWAKPDAGFKFAGWKMDAEEEYVSTEARYITVARAANKFTAVFEKEKATAVGAVVAKDQKKEIYDLAGRRVSKAKNKGLYVVNGKKTLVH